jgi:CRISPR-associated protein Csb2
VISITVELLHGTIRANLFESLAGAADHAGGEWPPSPARIFAALVAGGGTGADNSAQSRGDELLALEQAPPPIIAASAAQDVKTTALRGRYAVIDRSKEGSVQAYPARTSGLVRPGVRTSPKSRFVTYVWPEVELSDAAFAALRRRAARIGYFGCADSPARVYVGAGSPRDGRVIWSAVDQSHLGQSRALPVPFDGSLEALDRQFAEFKEGHSVRAAQTPRRLVRYSHERSIEALDRPRLLWLSFDSSFPARRALAVGEALRNAALGAYEALELGPVPNVLHGHGVERGSQHARYIPLPNVGHREAKGQILGACIWLPSNTPLEVAGNLQLALSTVERVRIRGGLSRAMSLRDPNASGRWATNPQRWAQPSREFASVFPVVHERFEKVSMATMLDVASRWCVNAGFPAPTHAVVSKVSRFAKIPAFSSSDVWRERSTHGYPFSHVTLRFAEPVRGPVVIGRGRSFGLGLMVPGTADGDDSGHSS